MEKISKSELRKMLFETLRPKLMERGFSLKVSKDTFLRQHDGVTDMFQLVCLDGKPGYLIQPNVAVRIERVEEIYHQTSMFEPKYQKDTPTFGSSVGIILHEASSKCEFLLEQPFQIAWVVEKIVKVFCDFALLYFKRWGSLQAIDAELNDNPAKRTPHRHLPEQHCSTGIIVAKLIGRPNYEQLAAFYAEVMKTFGNGFYFKQFQALLKSLENVEAGSGLTGDK